MLTLTLCISLEERIIDHHWTGYILLHENSNNYILYEYIVFYSDFFRNDMFLEVTLSARN